uniref:Uncharacterized protein n=1 Tax=Rhodnius prolixus TaxID=13249 RepID=T1HNH4_RHOPR
MVRPLPRFFLLLVQKIMVTVVTVIYDALKYSSVKQVGFSRAVKGEEPGWLAKETRRQRWKQSFLSLLKPSWMMCERSVEEIVKDNPQKYVPSLLK